MQGSACPADCDAGLARRLQRSRSALQYRDPCNAAARGIKPFSIAYGSEANADAGKKHLVQVGSSSCLDCCGKLSGMVLYSYDISPPLLFQLLFLVSTSPDVLAHLGESVELQRHMGSHELCPTMPGCTSTCIPLSTDACWHQHSSEEQLHCQRIHQYVACRRMIHWLSRHTSLMCNSRI